jgi:hypothetical protein
VINNEQYRAEISGRYSALKAQMITKMATALDELTVKGVKGKGKTVPVSN